VDEMAPMWTTISISRQRFSSHSNMASGATKSPIGCLAFQHVMTAVAINLARLVDWWDQGSTQRPP
ncbi:hypothetical protein, partial [Deinococcus sp.]|uniref:hypothetical protein n=1 Tax=Deinococcus sp. TaxID=47478 RepID=UPI00286D8302